MDNTQKQKAAELRRWGLRFSEIVRKLNLSRNTVKSFCNRNKITAGFSKNANICRERSKPLIQINRRKKRVFCYDECRAK